ncbi:T9SS type A sorting domain-containing protein [Botryobacter ruber]|uniref:T9SS type A sorting domain-containing protein n=1 Tax=Botryobacter ruber TaxID=2171629 RepID=UPI000E0B7226|nr:T9SS type A sorting domain-containing protein [Botryobacter ruber]
MKSYLLLFTFFFATVLQASAQLPLPTDDNGCVVLESECFTIKYSGVLPDVANNTAKLTFTVTAKCDIPFSSVLFQLPEGITPTGAQNGNTGFTYTQSFGTSVGSPVYPFIQFTASDSTQGSFRNGLSDVFQYTIPLDQFNNMNFQYTTMSGGPYNFTVCLNPKGCTNEAEIPEPVCTSTSDNGNASYGFIDATPGQGPNGNLTRVRFKIQNNSSSPIDFVQVKSGTRASHLSVSPINDLGQYGFIYLWYPEIENNQTVTYTKVNSATSTGMEEDVLAFTISTATWLADRSFEFTVVTEDGDASYISTSNIVQCAAYDCVILDETGDFVYTFLGATPNADNTSTLRFRIKNLTASPMQLVTFGILGAPESVVALTTPTYNVFVIGADDPTITPEILYERIPGDYSGFDSDIFAFTIPTANFEVFPFYNIGVFTADFLGIGGTGFNTTTCDRTPITPLPVELSSFDGKATPGGIELTWTTATETNNDRFEVQRSSDGKEYTTIGSVKGAGNSSTKLSYAYTDKAAARGINYYRLRQVDSDGTSALSKVIALESTSSATAASSMTIYPNPVTGDNVTITLDQAQVGKKALLVSLTDMNGRKVYEKLISSGDNELNVSLTELKLAKGLYLVKVQGEHKVETQKLLIK